MNEVSKLAPRSVEPAQGIDPRVSRIERIGLTADADWDKLERMLALKRDHDRDNARIAFSAALSEARAKIPPIIKDATVDFTSQKGRTHYKHETLAGIAKQIDPILSAHGLSYRSRTDQTNGSVRGTCIIEHAQGHSEETSLNGSPDTSGNKNGFQAVGSAVTYLQRYTLKAALGLSAEIDDDGRAAGQNNERPKFDARAAAARIATRISRVGTLDALSSLWGDEAETIKRIKAESPDEFHRLEEIKNAAKTKLSQSGPDAGDDLMDEIPY
jgi:hypothetical protein